MAGIPVKEAWSSRSGRTTARFKGDRERRRRTLTLWERMRWGFIVFGSPCLGPRDPSFGALPVACSWVGGHRKHEIAALSPTRRRK
ncbi:hypothetical protein LBMAG41_15860 [Cyanobium sp.]|nr:hypothetical protein LBMAG41_15860 [Cyanobium sp.]